MCLKARQPASPVGMNEGKRCRPLARPNTPAEKPCAMSRSVAYCVLRLAVNDRINAAVCSHDISIHVAQRPMRRKPLCVSHTLGRIESAPRSADSCTHAPLVGSLSSDTFLAASSAQAQAGHVARSLQVCDPPHCQRSSFRPTRVAQRKAAPVQARKIQQASIRNRRVYLGLLFAD